MSYRNKTYIIFDGDNDMWAYAFMKGWKENDRIDFDFHDAHDLKPLTDRAEDEGYIKSILRERFASAKQVIVLVGENTKNLYHFVRWEIEVAIKLDLPIIVVNLNNEREFDESRCPPILKDHYAVHIGFKLKIIQYALENWPVQYASTKSHNSGPRWYKAFVYQQLGI